jgi:hypothetical protein
VKIIIRLLERTDYKSEDREGEHHISIILREKREGEGRVRGLELDNGLIPRYSKNYSPQPEPCCLRGIRTMLNLLRRTAIKRNEATPMSNCKRHASQSNAKHMDTLHTEPPNTENTITRIKSLRVSPTCGGSVT